eukprot:9926908-Ditylum_brightwellii.AAC.1
MQNLELTDLTHATGIVSISPSFGIPIQVLLFGKSDQQTLSILLVKDCHQSIKLVSRVFPNYTQE